MATKYAISGNWNTNASWSTTSTSGPANTTKPTASDDVIFDANTGAVTIDATSVCRSIDLTNGGTSNYANTLTHNAFTLTVGTSTAPPGNVALKFPSSGWTYAIGSAANTAITLSSTNASATMTVNTGGVTLNKLTFSAASTSTYQLAAEVHLTGNSPAMRYTGGGLDTNNFDRKFEPGSGVQSEQYRAKKPYIDIRTGHNLTYSKRSLDDFRKKDTAVDFKSFRVEDIEGWPELLDILK